MNRHLNPDANCPTVLARLASDTSGNTLAMIAAAILPIMAMVGGGVDMGRSYLAQSRLQQACDAGVLAARKKLGTDSVEIAEVPLAAADVGQRFFNINFRSGSYGTENRDFVMTLEEDFSISGVASVEVPTTIMQMFGFDNVEIEVACEAQLNMQNTDIMFVLDTTTSMGLTNDGDDKNRIDTMRDVVKEFTANLATDSDEAARLRFGFLPYSSNVNVGGILKSDWMVDEMQVQSRRAEDSGNDQTVTVGTYYSSSWQYQSGTKEPIAEYVSASCPADTKTDVWTDPVDVSTSPHVYYRTRTRNGIDYTCTASDGLFTVTGWDYTDYLDKITYTQRSGYSYSYDIIQFDYDQYTFDVSSIKAASGDDPSVRWATISSNTYTPFALNTYWYHGCIEERATYEIHNWNNIDFDRALDLDLDLVPTAANDDTRWRPQFEGLAYARQIWWNSTGDFTFAPVLDTRDEYAAPSWIGDISACPAPAAKLQSWTSAEIDSYLDTLYPSGQTYHDIGMIWGGRMLSPNGLYADENADVNGMPTSRHLIFLTDGETEAYELAHGAYGIEPLDRRRWKESSTLSLSEVVERRFGVACTEVKKRNITIWVIAFGTELNPAMTECAGEGHYFEAEDSVELNAAFAGIAEKLKQLRITG